MMNGGLFIFIFLFFLIFEVIHRMKDRRGKIVSDFDLPEVDLQGTEGAIWIINKSWGILNNGEKVKEREGPR